MTTAELEAKVKELETIIAGLRTELEKKSSIVDNAEEAVHKMGEETGENRKALTAAARELVEARKAERQAAERLRTLEAELAEMKTKQGPAGNGGNNQPAREPTADEIEAGLTEAEQKALDAAFEQADQTTRARIKTEPEFRKRFLLMAKETAKAEASADLSTWRNKPAPKSNGSPQGDDVLAKLFKVRKNSAERVPDGPHGGSPRQVVRRPQSEEQPRRANADNILA